MSNHVNRERIEMNEIRTEIIFIFIGGQTSFHIPVDVRDTDKGFRGFPATVTTNIHTFPLSHE
jgi:hypothetical protein